ncbi:MAG: hypothetical protein JXQ75_08350 [Phycisphaerae bacterium]|nr:hypothetical protein [Phycisphaerae bacterium]
MNRHRRPSRSGRHGGADKPPPPRGPALSRRSRRRATEVLYHDDDLILVNKPAGAWTTRGPDNEPSVAQHLAAPCIIAGGGGLHAVYPLDIEASGILMLTRRAELLSPLRQDMADHTLDLRFLAIVRGPLGEQSGTIDRPVSSRDRADLARIDKRDGASATTDWSTRDTYIGFALLECRPRTTVPSQVRAHLQAAGMPLAVDREYGGSDHLMLSSFKAGYRPSRRRPERPLIQRLTLHAASVAFNHPTRGERLRFEVPPPKDFRATLHQLDKYGRIAPA